MKKEYNYDFDYVVPLETLRKNRIKAYKELCKQAEQEKYEEDKKATMRVIFIGTIISFMTALMFLSYFFK